MKHLPILPIMFAGSIAAFVSQSSFGEQSSAGVEPVERWDLRMIDEAHIWKNLKVVYSLAEPKKYWPVRRAALMKIVNEFPDSQWADDAALILACGKAEFENDANGAIAALKRVAMQDPNGQTIVEPMWVPGAGCNFNFLWLVETGHLLIYKSYDHDGEISEGERHKLEHFAHLNKYPRSTKLTAQLFITYILSKKGDRTGAVTVLEKIISNPEFIAKAVETAEADKKLNNGRMNRVGRPEYRVYRSLVYHYAHQGDIDKAITKAGELVNLASRDGFLPGINTFAGRFYEQHGLKDRAEQQYQLALDGLKRRYGSEDVRVKEFEESIRSR